MKTARYAPRCAYDRRMFLEGIIALLAATATAAPSDILERQTGAWKAEAAPLTYEGTQLYTFMDGGAEIYLEYGFERLESQSYQRGADEVAVELYRMGDGAYGLFTFLRPPDAEKLALGDAAFLSGYYLVLVKGPFLCAVTAQSSFPGYREAVLEVGGAIASRLPGAATAPSILSLLPEAGRIESTEKQLRGPVGLRNSSEKAADLFTGFNNGAVARYDPDCLAGFLQWTDSTAARQAWKRALEKLAPGLPSTDLDQLSLFGEPTFFQARLAGRTVMFATAGKQESVHAALGAMEAKLEKK